MYQVLYLPGSGVAATIWPIAYGVYNRRCNRRAVILAMLASLILGLIAYFLISSYAAPIVSAFVGMLIVVIGTKIAPDNAFRWADLRKSGSQA